MSLRKKLEREAKNRYVLNVNLCILFVAITALTINYMREPIEEGYLMRNGFTGDVYVNSIISYLSRHSPSDFAKPADLFTKEEFRASATHIYKNYFDIQSKVFLSFLIYVEDDDIL